MLNAIYIIWLREIKKFVRDRSRLVSSIAQPLIWLLLIGTGFGATFGKVGDLKYIQFMFPGILVMTLLFSSMFSAISIIWDRQFGFLKEMLVAPISRTSIAIGKSIGGASRSTIQALIILVFSPLLGIELTLLKVLLVVPLMFFISFTISGIGIIIAARMESFEGFNLIINFIIMPMFLLSGAIFPISNLPSWLSAIVNINPLSYGVDIMRWVMTGVTERGPFLDLVVLSFVCIITTTVSVYLFSKGK
ncbi:MAG: ABC-2 type transporter [Candidatus Methanofastidiosum methylothiophilum]|uniref:ABC-2 type transporter n=1 Tax=Candidatus Methanofastidiosum methylothiophilum TaxID=1705564 RepID=A0A150ISR7_9EURY|nr:MAG: ABC-2 type transporter [Candidatus Methanofastidiosum methylthiophilus]KYC48016.1 MAG: ABC-2 type transporter [Candidatus Methanofastidiosum methylthiophilus]KYC50706.1 MAG: ABC-2 type transporter [Candidatus Methanofastidiosum methylthiophilus]